MMNGHSEDYSEQCEIRNGQVETNGIKIWRLVLTGGPCGGKTTAQNRLATFFESLGWRVFRVPETATILLNGGISFGLLTESQRFEFQTNLLKTMLQLEDTYFSLARTQTRNCLVICDRGAMDCSAYLPKDEWERILELNNFNEVDLRDNRYHQVIHLVTAAKGAEEHYTRSNNNARTEDLSMAIKNDKLVGEAWVGHPYYEVIDNSSDFENKMRRLTKSVADKLGVVNAEEWLDAKAVKLKFLVRGPLPDLFPVRIRDFTVHHDYLPCSEGGGPQARIRRRGRHGKWMYTHTVRRQEGGEVVETRTNVSRHIYDQLLSQADRDRNVSIEKTRRCFTWRDQYYQLDIYTSPHPGLMLLETYTPVPADELDLPDFLEIEENVTGKPEYSMFNLSQTGNQLD